MKTFLRLPRQVVGVKTSLRRPYCLSKKKKIEKISFSENLSKALKADGKGENLIEAPLLSFKKKKKKQYAKEDRDNKFIMWRCMQVAGVL